MNIALRVATYISCICITFTVTAILPSMALAAKTEPTPDLSEARNRQIPPTQDELDRAKIVHITPVEPSVIKEIEADAFYFKFRNSVSFRAGGEWTSSDITNPGLTLGILYAYPLDDLRGVEAGADLNPDATGTLHFSRREMSGKERFRWFYKYGAGVRVVGSDQLVTFLRLRNWQARGGLGFECSLLNAMSFRTDLEAMLSTENVKALVSIGVAFAF